MLFLWFCEQQKGDLKHCLLSAVLLSHSPGVAGEVGAKLGNLY